MQSYLDPLLSLTPEQYAALGAGLALLVFGRRLYWLAVGSLGAVLAVLLAGQLGQGLEPEARLIVAAVAGIAGALFALAAQKMALVFAGVVLGGLGFGAGTYVVMNDVLFQEPAGWPLVAAGIGAVFGLLFARSLFDGTLIVVSAAVGALLLTRSLSDVWLLTSAQEAVGLIALFVVGMAAQTGRKRKRRPDDD